MGRSTTDSYIIEYKIIVNEGAKCFIENMFKYASRMQNITIKYAKNQLQQLHEDKEYQRLLTQYRSTKGEVKKEVGNQLKALVATYKISDFDLQHFIVEQQRKYKKYIHSDMAAKLATNVYSGVSKILYSTGKQLHFKKGMDLRTLSCKKQSGIIFNPENRIVTIQKYLILPVKIRKKDIFAQLALNSKIKYCNLIRKPSSTGWKYYVQVVFEGAPPAKYTANGKLRSIKSPNKTVGIDPGTSTIAATNNKECLLKELAPNINKYNDDIIKYSTELEYLRRINNPDYYNNDGTIKKGKKNWFLSNKYKRVYFKLLNAYRRRSAYIKESHCKLANEILKLGNVIHIEKMNYKALAKRALETETSETTGLYKSKSRFGKSIQLRAPAMLKDTIKQKLKYKNHDLLEVNTRKLKASRYNHETDTYTEKELTERWNIINNKEVQRDLYSAFIILNCNEELEHPDRTACINNYKQFKKAHDKCIKQIIESGVHRPSSFGF